MKTRSTQFAPVIEKTSQLYSVDSKLIRAIIQQESEFNPWVVRYEVNYRYLLTPEKFAGSQNSLSTELNNQKMSWGLGQIMGGLAREQGFIEILPMLLIPEYNIEQVCIRVKALLKQSQEPADIFATYNGGLGALRKTDGKYRNQSYVDSTLKHFLRLGDL